MIERKPIQIQKPCILIVEGKHDKAFFEAFCDHFQKDLQVIALQGKDNLKNRLESIKNESNFRSTVKSIGIVMDADEDPKSTFRSIQDSLRRIELACPSKPFEFIEGKPRIGIAILPDENTPGELEDLCLKVIQEESTFCCVERYFRCLMDNGAQLKKISKAKIYAYLSSKERPELRLGEAAKAGYLRFDHPALCRLKDFICCLTT